MEPFRVLVVCTGNICRSPAIVALVRQTFPPQTALVLSSAGTQAVDGAPIHPLTVEALSERGMNDALHAARQLTPAMVADADLVLTAERSHRVAVVEADWTAVRRTFTLAEFARLAGDGPPEPGWASLVGAAASRRGSGRPSDPSIDDLADPIAGSLDDHKKMVRRVASLIARVSGTLRA